MFSSITSKINITLVIVVLILAIVVGLVVAMMTGYDLSWFPDTLKSIIDKF